MARIVIADAGPLIAFAGIDQLGLLRKLLAEVCILETVRDECLAKPGSDAERIKAAIAKAWLVVETLPEPSRPLSPSLGIGESDSIRLAMEQPENSLLIMDDRLARRYALKQGLQLIGTVRLLDLAEQHGMIASAEQCIQDMAEFGYRISIELLKKLRCG